MNVSFVPVVYIIVICDSFATYQQSQTWLTRTIYMVHTIIRIGIHLGTNMQLQ
jgi:hypothetical protein